MARNIINVSYSKNTHKKAVCKGECHKFLIEGCKILSISRSQGKFISVSNYCMDCAEKELQSALDEVLPLAKRIIEIQSEIDGNKEMMDKIETIAKEAMIKYNTTMEKLGNS
jgi:hypothetical protein